MMLPVTSTAAATARRLRGVVTPEHPTLVLPVYHPRHRPDAPVPTEDHFRHQQDADALVTATQRFLARAFDAFLGVLAVGIGLAGGLFVLYLTVVALLIGLAHC